MSCHYCYRFVVFDPKKKKGLLTKIKEKIFRKKVTEPTEETTKDKQESTEEREEHNKERKTEEESEEKETGEEETGEGDEKCESSTFVQRKKGSKQSQ